MTCKEKVVAIGMFDGVHKGHLAVLDTLKQSACENGHEAVAITFTDHPLLLIAPERAPKLLTDCETKKMLLEEAGVKSLFLDFDENLRSTSVEEWIKYLAEELGVKKIIAGYDNTFGCDGVDLSLHEYMKIGEQYGVKIIEAPYVEGVSSSAIRKAIERGEITEAEKMSGRPFFVRGEVVGGNKLGRTIGFPTANVKVKKNMLVPGRGVYAAMAAPEGGKEYPAMVNIGVKPTVSDENNLSLEAHIIGWEGDLYGKKLQLRFIDRLRDETDFKTIENLRQQLETDRKETLRIIKEKNNAK